MLELAVKEGTGRNGKTKAALAGKTGTASFEAVKSGARDAWFVGYTPSVVGAVWFGYDITSSENYLKGGSAYPTAWFKELVSKLPTDERLLTFKKPHDVKELKPPVRLAKINDLEASLILGGKGLMSVKLEWTGIDDERVQYDIYEVDHDVKTHLATVTDGSGYLHPRLNPFSSKTYIVVPLDSTTERHGEPSNSAEVNFGFGF